MPSTPDPLILALGDSLTAGYGLPSGASFPARLEALLRQHRPSAQVLNAGVSGNTSADLLRRLPGVLAGLQHRPALAIVQIGPNDVIRSLPPAQTRANLNAIVEELERRQISVLLATIAPPPAIAALAQPYVGIHEDVARKHGLITHPFFPDGLLGHRKYILPDRLHPSAEAIEIVADQMLPAVLAALE